MSHSEPAAEMDWDELDRRALAQQQADRDQREAEAREQRRAVIPTKFRNARLEHSDVSMWVTNQAPAKPALFLTGPNGTGKTHIAWAIIARMHEHVTWAFWRSTALLDQLRPDGVDPYATLHQAQHVDLLVIDDMGAEKPSAWTQERFYELIDERYCWQRRTVITSNKPPRDLAGSVSNRVASRIAEMSLVVPLLGTDRRRAS